MNIIGFDLETTGLDPVENDIIEIAAVLWDEKQAKPLTFLSHLVGPATVPANITQITGITQDMLDKYAVPPHFAMQRFKNLVDKSEAVAYAAHNGTTFDLPFLKQEFKNVGLDFPNLPLIDTRYDIVYPVDIKSRNLDDIATGHNIKNPFAHRALLDVLTMLQVLSSYSVPGILEVSVSSPLATILTTKKAVGFWWWPEQKKWRRHARVCWLDLELRNLGLQHPRQKFWVHEPKPEITVSTEQ